MNNIIVCGEDKIELTSILNADVREVRFDDLYFLEKKYNGDLDDSFDSFLIDYPSYSDTDSDFHNKLEKMLNNYESVIGVSCRKTDYIPSYEVKYEFSVGSINQKGDADVFMTYTDRAYPVTDTLQLSDDVIPAIEEYVTGISNNLRYLQSKKLNLIDKAFGVPNQITWFKKTKKELNALLNEYKKRYGKARELEQNNQMRTKKRNEFYLLYSNNSILIIETKEKKYYYLDGLCNFNIYQKKVEIDKEIEKLKIYKSNQIKHNKEIIYKKIISEFNGKNLLSKTSLTNKEKLTEYGNIREFCFNTIPILRKKEFDFDIFSKQYSEYISLDSLNSFKTNWNRLNKSYVVLNKGENGEKKVNEVLQLFNDRIFILQNFVWKYEHDFIIITPYGISTIEVKNLRGDYVLTETGVLKCRSSEKVVPKDVALQSKKHLESLRRLLNSCPAFSDDIPLQEIICSAEGNFTIENHYQYIPVCYYNTVDKLLLKQDGNIVLNKNSMNMIKDYLLDNQQEPYKYNVFTPRGEIDSRDNFIESFSDVASGYLAVQEVNMNE